MNSPLTIPVAAALVGLTKARIWQLCRAGHFGKKVGRDWLIDPHDLALFSASHWAMVEIPFTQERIEEARRKSNGRRVQIPRCPSQPSLFDYEPRPLRPSTGRVLAILKNGGPYTTAQIGAIVGWKPQSVGARIRELRTHGYRIVGWKYKDRYLYKLSVDA